MALYLGANKVSFQQGDVTAFLQLQNKTVSPTTSLQTITADSGYHALQSVKVNAMPTMTLPTAASGSASGTLKATISRSTSNQYINIPTGYNTAAGYYLISATPNGSVTAPSSISSTGASVSTGTNTLTFTKTISVTPNVTTAGYISAGTAGNSSVSLTASITTKAAQTYTPTTSNQTISAGQYLTGAQTIKGDANLLARNIKNGVTIFNVAGTYNGPEDDVTDAVRFFDYDGTVKYSYSAAQFLALTAMPANPSHTGLTAQGWNWTLTDAKAHVTQFGFLDIGQMYTTSSGATEIDIELHKGRLAPYLGLGVNGTVNINWGDGSATDSLTGTSLTTQVRIQHTYATEGNYTIKISIASGSFAFRGTSTYYLLNANNSSSNRNRVYANSVKAVRIGSGNITLGQYAFYYCTSLQYVTIPNSIVSINNSNLFSSCYNLRCITIPFGEGTLSTLPGSCFSGCYCLRAISLCNKLTTIGGGSVFTSCYSLDSLIFPASITTAPTSSVYDTSTVRRVDRLIVPWLNLRIIRIKDYNANMNNLTSISSYKFAYIPTLKTAVIPNTVTQINSYAFSTCDSLTSITLPSTGCTFNGSDQFENCYSLNTINNLDKVTSLGTGSYNFSSCYSLSGPITLASTITTVPSNLFMYNSSLQSVTLPTSLTAIPSYLFYQCYSLSKLIIPSGVTTIGTYACYTCYGLSSLTIPASVTTINSSAFSSCYGLGELYVQSTTPPTLSSTNVFSNLPDDCVIYVPSASLSAYQSATNWATYASQMVGV